MKTNRLYVLALDQQPGKFLYSKLFMVSLIIALIFAALPAASVFAAPASGQNAAINSGLEQEWKNKLNHLRYQGLYYENIRLYPADYEDLSDLARAHYYLEKYGVALRGAQTVVLNHTGFDLEGRVINEVQAAESARQLAEYLHMMRGLRDKIEEVPNKR